MTLRLIALLVLASCAAPCDIGSVRDRWYAATGLAEPEDLHWETPYTFTVPCKSSELAYTDDFAATTTKPGFVRVTSVFIGCFTKKNEALTIRIAAEHDQCGIAALHEYGHALGGRHHTGRGVLTSSSLRPGYIPIITKDDVEDVCEYRLCPWQRPEG